MHIENLFGVLAALFGVLDAFRVTCHSADALTHAILELARSLGLHLLARLLSLLERQPRFDIALPERRLSALAVIAALERPADLLLLSKQAVLLAVLAAKLHRPEVWPRSDLKSCHDLRLGFSIFDKTQNWQRELCWRIYQQNASRDEGLASYPQEIAFAWRLDTLRVLAAQYTKHPPGLLEWRESASRAASQRNFVVQRGMTAPRKVCRCVSRCEALRASWLFPPDLADRLARMRSQVEADTLLAVLRPPVAQFQVALEIRLSADRPRQWPAQ
jgi:hypothetical protein